ncbi:MAG: selenide, water dikinase SelD [Spirochaetaceae bacterium]|jgi:selenide,water dikinase|nr:selenide, water dikinase SelD [Spirochaetaceae bacterium]
MNQKPLPNLLSNCTSGGCGAKLGPGELAGILAVLEVKQDPALLVGFGGRDDAAVYRIDDERALVSTVDFFSPMVNDPFCFGKIAAANALSDIYAMGGKPLFALNLSCFPEKLDRSILIDILAGGAAKALEADMVIAGGHSIFDHEPKYGLAVTGVINPRRILRNDTCKAGDALILTKPLGAGLVMAAYRAGEADEAVVAAAVDSMERLNRRAAEKMTALNSPQRVSPDRAPVHACTDITGFGLAVHASEMAGGAYTMALDGASLPLLPGAAGFAESFFATAAGQRNRNYMSGRADVSALSPALQEIVFDPQTSGGLLIAVAPEAAQELCDAIRKDDPGAAIIGEVIEREDAAVVVA